MQLTRPVTLGGTVTRFKGNGRRLGYPTANLTIKTDLADGVYFGLADLADWSDNPAVIFIG
ncbi:MAG: riboflavin kinase, partial [Candidatus Binatota bacterium]|nr:riboflavin kinase [Candidatus Binatota bacterium]